MFVFWEHCNDLQRPTTSDVRENKIQLTTRLSLYTCYYKSRTILKSPLKYLVKSCLFCDDWRFNLDNF